MKLLGARRVFTLVAAIGGVALGIYVISHIVAFANIFGIFRDHAGIRSTQLSIAEAHNSTNPDIRTPVVPKVIHQIFHSWKRPGNNTLPAHWALARQSCIDHNPDWEVKLWTTEASRELIEDEFPWFLSTYDGYKFPIQRVDVVRYFAVLKYGGIYIDLDNGCASSLEAMTYLPAFTTDGGHGALSNNIIGGQPGHPYFRLLTENLIPYNWNLFLPYIIISWTSGQWFVTAMWEKYHSLLSPDGSVKGFDGHHWRPLHHVLMDMRDGADPWVFFTQVPGGTWSNWDSDFFPWLGDHLFLVFSYIILTLAVVIGSCVCLSRWWSRRRTRSKGYKEVASVEQGDYSANR